MGRGLDGFFDTRSVTLCGFEGPSRGRLSPLSGGYGEGETPLPIPNRAVKPLSADGTWPSRARESRTPPVLSSRAAPGGGSSSLTPRTIPARARPDRLRRQPRRAADAARRRLPARLHGPAVQHRAHSGAADAGHDGGRGRGPDRLRRASLPLTAAGGVVVPGHLRRLPRVPG